MILFAYYKRLHFMLLYNKCALVREGSSYPRNRTSMGMSVSVLAHLAMKHVFASYSEAKVYSMREL